ncbi:TonB-dependent receptor [Pseudoxanthomonas indica]|uniref:TonB-dependent receptor n=1 Tax=Pseudoxanthomonas indica TaxID=428993 RepID=UPI0009A8010D|nr:TonB-dependent receptor [Pseudoxanthomonas indica]
MPQDTPTDHANSESIYQDAYALLGFRVEYLAPTNGWSVFVVGDNLTDRRHASSSSMRHQATAAQPGFLSGLGRNVSVGVSWFF